MASLYLLFIFTFIPSPLIMFWMDQGYWRDETQRRFRWNHGKHRLGAGGLLEKELEMGSGKRQKHHGCKGTTGHINDEAEGV